MTIKDIAKLADVSVSTVSRVLNDRPDVSEDSRRRVRAVIEAHRYVPNNSARDLVKIRSDAVGLVVRGVQNPFYTDIIHAIEAHHGDVEPKTPLAFIIQAADAISAARPGARRENVESYVKRLENLEEISSSFEGVEQAFAVQAGREVRIMVKPDVISDDQVILLARSIAKKIEDTLDYPGQIKVNVIRESRAVEYAK